MTITPDQARELLDGATPRPWSEDGSNIMNHDGDPLLSDGSFGDPNWYNDRDLTLMTAAPELAQTIAGMTEQWRHEAWHDRGDGTGPWRSLCWPHDDGWRNTRESADFDLAQAEGTFKHRLVRRRVGPVEVAE